MRDDVAASRSRSGLTEDLLDPRVGHARSVGHGSLAASVRDGLTDRVAPCLLGRGTPRGCATNAGEAIHLVGDAARAEKTLRVGLRLRVACVAGLSDEGLRPSVVQFSGADTLGGSEADGAAVSLGGVLCSEHMARILARAELVK